MGSFPLFCPGLRPLQNHFQSIIVISIIDFEHSVNAIYDP